MFCPKYDFGNSWYLFASATSDNTRQLNISIAKDQFPYWVQRLGVDDHIRATFAVIDWTKSKLTLAPGAVDFSGDAASGWTLAIDHNSPVFAFLKKNKAATVYMAVSYAMAE